MDGPERGLRAYTPELAIVLASVLYGLTFRVIQVSVERTSPSAFVLLRYGVGALVMLPFAWRRGWRGPRALPRDGRRLGLTVAAAVGLLAALGSIAQTVGLRTTSTSNSAFITGLFAVFTAAIESLVYRRWPRREILVAVALSVFGLYLLTGASLSLRRGDALTLLAAAMYGGWYVVIGAYANRLDVVTFTCAQIAFVALVSAPFAIAEGFGHVDAYVVGTVLFTGIGCTAFAFAISAWAQRRIEPSRTTIISLVEPVVAGAVGWWIGERLGIEGYVGAAVIVAAILVAERGTHPRRAAAPASPEG